ncbi:MAG TPA: hypothetical protein VGD67_22135 [Pseudonocardiaceae bacterium]
MSALKLGAILTLLLGSFLAMAPAASAAPASAPAAVSTDGASIAATYSCNVVYNTQVFIFDNCNVTSGSIRLAIICSNGVQYLGPILGTGYWNGDWGINCAPGRWVEVRVYHLS